MHIESKSVEMDGGVYLLDKRNNIIGGPFSSNEEADKVSRHISRTLGEAPLEEYRNWVSRYLSPISEEARRALLGKNIEIERVKGLSKDGAHGKYYKGQDKIQLDANSSTSTLNHELNHAYWDQLQRQHGLMGMPGLYGLLGFRGNPHKNKPFEDVHGDPMINRTPEAATLDHFILYKDKPHEQSEYSNINRQRMLKNRPDMLLAQEYRKKLLDLWQPVAQSKQK